MQMAKIILNYLKIYALNVTSCIIVNKSGLGLLKLSLHYGPNGSLCAYIKA